MPFRQKQLKKRKKRSSGKLARLAEAALHVDADSVRSHEPRSIDIDIAQALLQGAVSQVEIAEMIDCGTEKVRKALRNPVAFAWVCQQVSKLIYTRIGLVDAALLRKACSGDPRAIEIYYKRFGKLADIKIVAHGALGDLSQYSDADLDRTIASELKRDPALAKALSPPQSSSSVVDVTPEEVALSRE